MWFDARKALEEIEGGSAPPLDSTRPNDAAKPEFVAMSQLSQHPTAQKTDTQQAQRKAHGVSFGGRPKTWTGRVVSLDAWRALSEWERHGSSGKSWNGAKRQWEQPKGTPND